MFYPRERNLGVEKSGSSVTAPSHYWSLPSLQLLEVLASSPSGLSDASARLRLQQFGENRLRHDASASRIRTLWNQVKSPLLLLLLSAAGVSVFSGELTDAAIVTVIVLATVGVGYYREYQASQAVALLQARVRTQVKVQRDGAIREKPIEQLVPGDIVRLAAGSLVPADCVVLEAADCHVSEAALTGESFPVEKAPGQLPADTPLSKRHNCVYLGTNVRSGTAKCLVVATASATEFGAIAQRLSLTPPETDFERGVRRFGYLLMSSMLGIVLVVFAAHVVQGRPPIQTLLFAIALAVGLSPELLPAILTINLSRAAQVMARHGVLVRRLNAVENLGSMDILCTDKTGTLTKGVVQLDRAHDPNGVESNEVLELAALNAAFETGLPSPLDDAILSAHAPNLASVQKLAEIPFDFTRKRVGVVVQDAQSVLLIVKGAFQHVISVSNQLADGTPISETQRAGLHALYSNWSTQGMRVIGVATRRLQPSPTYTRDAEQDLQFRGFLTFLDQPKPGVDEAIQDLARLGVGIKVITGDSKLVAEHIAGLVGLSHAATITGRELDALHDEALWQVAEHTDLFAEVDPNQKERILLALKRTGHVVGFLGDGVNDAPAMHAADVSISVDQAVDVARAAADFVLLEQDLHVIRRGIEEGRRTFANTLKYIFATTSANLGNMLSMAVASLFLPFLPLLAGQILLNNFISDIPAVGMAEDQVDPEWTARPRRWNMGVIARFMTVFGLLSSFFDLLTFALLLFVFHATPERFRTAWFVESLLTELIVALIVRTRGPFTKSRPGRTLLVSTLALIPVTLAIPYLPQSRLLGFEPLPGLVVGALLGVTLLYAAATEVTKLAFYRRHA